MKISPSIHILSEDVANKIAAGEVIERPASVIKELLENAIDANATHITIHTEKAGLSLIRVVDNGSGMNEEDLRLSIQRHATSKILSDYDLKHIITLGFRGEAMASIAAVSRMEIKSLMHAAESGHSIEVEGGIIRADGISTGASGTSIAVHDLFFNTPARKEFLKSEAAENLAINDTVTRFALGYPKISFLLVNDGKRIIQTSGNGRRLDVISTIYGTEIARNMMFVSASGESEQLHIQGEIAPPPMHRANRKHISTYVNGRWIKNKLLDDAVVAAYETYLPLHRFPICVLDLTIPPDKIDVNVHPAKLEIRFHREDIVFQFVRDSIKAKLSAGLQTPGVFIPGKSVYSRSAQERIHFPRYTGEKIEPYLPKQSSETPVDVHSQSSVDRSRTEAPIETANGLNTSVPDKSARETIDSEPLFRVIGQIFTTYILIEKDDEILIVDQHAAQERTMFEKMMQNTECGNPAQQLMIPESVDLTPTERIIAQNTEDILHEVGFEFDYASGNTVFLRAIPADLPIPAAADLFRTVLADTEFSERKPHQTEKREQIIRAACRASIKANDRMTMDEMITLVDQLLESANPFTCPHGRPTLLRLSKAEFERMFKRIQ